MKRVLLLLPATGYRNADFLAAGKKLGRSLVRVGRTRRMARELEMESASDKLLPRSGFVQQGAPADRFASA